MPAKAQKPKAVESPHPLFPDAQRAHVGEVQITRNGRKHSAIPHAEFTTESELRDYCRSIGVGEYICQPLHFETRRMLPGKVQFVLETSTEDAEEDVTLRAMKEEYQLLERSRQELVELRKLLEADRKDLDLRRLAVEQKSVDAQRELQKSVHEASVLSASQLNSGMQDMLGAQRDERDSVRAMESQMRRDHESREERRRTEHDTALRALNDDRRRYEEQADTRARETVSALKAEHAAEMARVRIDLKATFDTRFENERRMLRLEFTQKEGDMKSKYALENRDDLPDEIRNDYLSRLLNQTMPEASPVDSLLAKYAKPAFELFQQAQAMGLVPAPGAAQAPAPPAPYQGPPQQLVTTSGPAAPTPEPEAADDEPPYIPASMRWGLPSEEEEVAAQPVNGEDLDMDNDEFAG